MFLFRILLTIALNAFVKDIIIKIIETFMYKKLLFNVSMC